MDQPGTAKRLKTAERGALFGDLLEFIQLHLLGEYKVQEISESIYALQASYPFPSRIFIKWDPEDPAFEEPRIAKAEAPKQYTRKVSDSFSADSEQYVEYVERFAQDFGEIRYILLNFEAWKKAVVQLSGTTFVLEHGREGVSVKPTPGSRSVGHSPIQTLRTAYFGRLYDVFTSLTNLKDA